MEDSNSQEFSALQKENQALKEQLGGLMASGHRVERHDHLKQAEENTNQGKLLFETIFEESSLGNKIINSKLQILKVNKALEDLLGYSKKELLGNRIIEFSHPDFKKDWNILQKKLWTSELPSFSIEIVLIKKDGSSIWCKITSITFKDHGETLGYTVLEDISQRKSVEKIRSERESKKDDFISIVSHELKTPLTNIKAFNQLLERTVEKDEDHYKYIEKSQGQIRRLERLIKDLLDVTKINSGDFELDSSEFDFNDLLEEGIESVQCTRPDFDFIFNREGALWYCGDRFRMEQVFINLLDNAVKYSSGIKRVIVKAEKNDNQVSVSIEDFGVGISGRNIQKLTDRFYRVRETAMNVQGIGLGLFIVKEILKKHGGELTIDSRLGSGSTFTFVLPLNKDNGC